MNAITTQDMLLIAGFILTLVVNVGTAAYVYGKVAARLDSLEQTVNKDGKQSFVRAAEVDLLVKQADAEHRVINSEIGTLRERTHLHEKLLGEHESRLDRLEEETA